MPKMNAIWAGSSISCVDCTGIPAHFVIRPARSHDTTAINNLVCMLPFGSVLFGNRGYDSEPLRHHLDASTVWTMITIHRASIMPNPLAEQQLLRLHRKRIETSHSLREKMGMARLHARLAAGVSRKIAASLCTLSVPNYYETRNQGINSILPPYPCYYECHQQMLCFATRQ